MVCSAWRLARGEAPERGRARLVRG
jgi:hypothetical protein